MIEMTSIRPEKKERAARLNRSSRNPGMVKTLFFMYWGRRKEQVIPSVMAVVSSTEEALMP